jgi:hypothetical protein
MGSTLFEHPVYIEFIYLSISGTYNIDGPTHDFHVFYKKMASNYPPIFEYCSWFRVFYISQVALRKVFKVSSGISTMKDVILSMWNILPAEEGHPWDNLAGHPWDD